MSESHYERDQRVQRRIGIIVAVVIGVVMLCNVLGIKGPRMPDACDVHKNPTDNLICWELRGRH